MEFEELLRHLRFEYWATLAADPRCQDDFDPRILHLEEASSFYDYLISRGFSRFCLSAHGIGRDIEA